MFFRVLNRSTKACNSVEVDANRQSTCTSANSSAELQFCHCRGHSMLMRLVTAACALTDIAPHRCYDIDIVVPNNSVHETLEVYHGDPYCIAPYRKTKLSNLRYERQQRQDDADEVPNGRYRVRRESIHNWGIAETHSTQLPSIYGARVPGK